MTYKECNIEKKQSSFLVTLPPCSDATSVERIPAEVAQEKGQDPNWEGNTAIFMDCEFYGTT